jgi:hypothetical protein
MHAVDSLLGCVEKEQRVLRSAVAGAVTILKHVLLARQPKGKVISKFLSD